MARIVGLMGSMAINNTVLLEHAALSTVYVQSVRWRRKPSWMPPCKGKMFKVIKVQRPPEDERKELLRLYCNYNTNMNSLMDYLKKRLEDVQSQENIDIDRMKNEEDFRKCSEINDEWNKKVAAQRELRLARERQERRDAILQELIEQEKIEKELQEKIEEEIRKIKKEVHTYITEENIDQAIEEALATTVDYNAALDLDGNWYPGSEPNVVKKKAQTQGQA